MDAAARARSLRAEGESWANRPWMTACTRRDGSLCSCAMRRRASRVEPPCAGAHHFHDEKRGVLGVFVERAGGRLIEAGYDARGQ